MSDRKQKWYASMRQKLGVETDEEVRDFLRLNLAKSSRNAKGTGGFAYLKAHDPDRHKQVSRAGGQHGKSTKTKDGAERQNHA